MLDPEKIYDVDPDVAAVLPTGDGVTGPVLLHALDGYVDAGNAAEQLVEHLRATFPAERLVTFDVDQLLNYRARRPLMVFDEDRWESYDDPELAIDLLRDAEGTPFLLLYGREPDLQWERVVASLRAIVERFGVSLVVGTQGVPMGVPHTRPVGATASATRSELIGVQPRVFGRVTVPAGFSHLLERRLGEAGVDAMGFSIHVPHYLAQGSFAPAALAAASRIERTTGLDLRSGDLEPLSKEAIAEIDEQATRSEEVQKVVAHLEAQYDSFVAAAGRTNLLAEAVPIPTAEEIGAELERFLAEQSAGDDGDA